MTDPTGTARTRQLTLSAKDEALRRTDILVYAYRYNAGQPGTVALTCGAFELDLRLTTAELRALSTLVADLADEMDVADCAAALPAPADNDLTAAVARMVGAPA